MALESPTLAMKSLLPIVIRLTQVEPLDIFSYKLENHLPKTYVLDHVVNFTVCFFEPVCQDFFHAIKSWILREIMIS